MPDGSNTGLVSAIAEDIADNIWLTTSVSSKRADPHPERACAGSILHIASACRALHRAGSPGRYLARLSGWQPGPLRLWEARSRQDSHHGAGTPPRFRWIRTAPCSRLAFRADRNRRREAPNPFFANGLPCDDAMGFTPDRQGALWIYMACGLARISDSDSGAGCRIQPRR